MQYTRPSPRAEGERGVAMQRRERCGYLGREVWPFEKREREREVGKRVVEKRGVVIREKRCGYSRGERCGFVGKRYGHLGRERCGYLRTERCDHARRGMAV